MTRRALGRGLSALITDNSANNNEEFQEIAIELIEPNNLQPRTKFDENLLDELAMSIKENGIVQPILVRRIDAGHYQIIAGERRWRATQRAGLTRIPAIIKSISDDKMLELALIENIQRQELNPIEEAHAYKKLIDTLNLTQESVAQRVGRDRTFVTNYLRLLRLPEDIQQLVEENKLSMGHARTLLGVEDKEQQRSLAKTILERGLSVRETERMIKSISDTPRQTKIAANKTQDIDANVRLAEIKLRRRFSTQVKILSNPQTGGGKIEIYYYDTAALHKIFDLLSPNQSENETN